MMRFPCFPFVKNVKRPSVRPFKDFVALAKATLRCPCFVRERERALGKFPFQGAKVSFLYVVCGGDH